jgi:nucleoside-diphosphate-sugar epimerase
MNVLITGASGFLGANLISAWKSSVDVKLFAHSRNLANLQRQISDSINPMSNCSSEELNKNQIDAIVHLAGIAHDLAGQYRESDYDQVNFKQTATLFDAFLASGATKFIFVSSIKAVIDKANSPVAEEVSPLPVTPYGKSKLKAEQYIQAKGTAEGKRFFIVRPCMVHGPLNKGNLNLLYRFVKSGLPFPFGAFQNQRSFLSVDNFTFVMECLLFKNIASGIYHVADNGYLSTVDLVKWIAACMGKRATVWSFPAGFIRFVFSFKRGMLEKLTENMMVDNSRIINAIGQPLPVSMKEGLKKTIQSFK